MMAGTADIANARAFYRTATSRKRDEDLAAAPGRRRALRLMRTFRVGVLVFGATGVVASLLCHSSALLGLTLVITVEEMIEGSVVIAVLRGRDALLRRRR